MANEEQTEFWAEGLGQHWLRREAQIDLLFAPIDQALLDRAGDLAGRSVLDIGSGTGSTIRKFSDAAKVLSADVSPHFVKCAQDRAAAAGLDHYTHIVADAQTDDLGADHDLTVSRYGVMFFEDPVAGFANIRSAMKPGGQMIYACWGPFKENPWFSEPFFAATDHLGRPPPADPRAPGPFAFADADYVLGVLQNAGWSEARVEPAEVTITFPGDATAAAEFTRVIGPSARVIREMNGTEADMDIIVANLADRWRAREVDGKVTMTVRLNILRATA